MSYGFPSLSSSFPRSPRPDAALAPEDDDDDDPLTQTVSRSYDSNCKSSIFPENALQLHLDDADAAAAADASTPSASLDSEPPEPALAPALVPRPSHVRFAGRVRIASGLQRAALLRRASELSVGRGTLTPDDAQSEFGADAASTQSSPAPSITASLRPGPDPRAPRGSYSQRLLALARPGARAAEPPPPARPRRAPRLGERTPLVGARSGRTYVFPRTSSNDSGDSGDDGHAGGFGLLDYRWWKVQAQTVMYCCYRDESDEEDA